MRGGYAKGPERPSPPSPSSPSDAPAGLSRRAWALLVLAFAAIHWLSLWVATLTGNFDPNPNHDHVRVMRQVLESGYPGVAIWPPGYGYYLALKWQVTQALGLPYWSAKLFIDLVPVVLSGVLSTLLALDLTRGLTRSRTVAVVSGLAMVAAPIFALASAEDLAVILFQPLFLAALLVLARTLRAGGGLAGFAGAGALVGLSCLVRANPQFLLLALAPVAWWWLRRSEVSRAGRRVTRPGRTVAVGLLVALAAQTLVLLPWSLLQRNLGQSGAVAAPVVYYAFFDGIRRHDGFTVSEALRADPDPPPLSFDGVVEFHREWLRRDPGALARLYGAKIVRTWYLSDSGRWDRAIALAHAPLWLLAIAGLGVWLRRRPGDPALWLVAVTVLYFWAVSAAVSGLARYMAPVQGLLGLLAGVALVALAELARCRRPA